MSHAALARGIERLRAQHEKMGDKLDALEARLDELGERETGEGERRAKKKSGKKRTSRRTDEDEDEDEDEGEDEDERD